MKHITLINGNETETTMTRAEILESHKQILSAHDEKMNFLRSIHNEEPIYQGYLSDAERDTRDEAARLRDLGLTTEENNKDEAVSVSDTVESVTDLLSKYPNGFKGFIRNSRGEVIPEPYTKREDKEAELWAASLVK